MSGLEAPVLAAIIGGGATVASTVAGSLLAGKPKVLKASPTPTRIEARERADQNDILARRKGTNANKHVGFGAGEAFTGQKKSLLGR